ncbi:MAG TPA: branched-chain amino acid ABC transporter permease [Ktedonobacteraceae bacterium]|jgi:ABC-type branched-subunit amino acid transport system permease subunit|nr:branched-chain amino acid ABC transporter permease [Ktedonobacteraceae bacterium]
MRLLKFPDERETRLLFVKWLVALLIPVLAFTLWDGESILNNTLLTLFTGFTVEGVTTIGFVLSTVFVLIFYAVTFALAGYFLAADSGRRSMIELWIDVVIFTLVPMLLVILTTSLVVGLALCIVVWPIYFWVRKRVVAALHYAPPDPLDEVMELSPAQQDALKDRGRSGGFWFGTAFSLIWLVIDLVYLFSGGLPTPVLIFVILRTILFPVFGLLLGQLGGELALRRTLGALQKKADAKDKNAPAVDLESEIKSLSPTRAREEVKELVPNDQPMRSRGAQLFYLALLAAFVLLYPALDPLLFSFGTVGRISGFADAGYYVILALGLNIVVGFAGLLDLGYVAFFAIGAYTWALIGSGQFTVLTGLQVNPQVWPWLFWPVLILSACVAAFWGVLLGIPTLRLRGDYLAIVTLGFGEIIPIIFLQMDKYTNGTNGVVGIFSPHFPGINWTTFTPVPYYYLILALIVLLIFINLRLRDSRLGRAWIAIREDEIAAASSGINLANTKLFAFGAGAFFSGIAGAYHAAKVGNVTPDAFSYNDSIIYLAMVVIGGLGSIPGVIVGALVVYAVNQLILAQLDTMAADPSSVLHIVKVLAPTFTFDSIRNLIFGTILVTVMLFRPEGLIPSARRRRELHHVDQGQDVEVGSLDVPPGTPGFESEIRVE